MTPRVDRHGDELEDGSNAADGKCPKCDLFVCGCCRFCGGRTRPGWTAHPSCERAAQ